MSRPLLTHPVSQSLVAQSSNERSFGNILLARRFSVASRLALVFFMGVAVVWGAQAFRRQIGDPWSEITASLAPMALTCVAGALLLAVVGIIERKLRPPSEHARKFAHVGTGAIAFFAPAFFATHWPVLALAIMFSAALLVSRRFGWLTSIHLPVRRGKGDLLFLWAVYLIFLLAEGNSLLFQVPVLVLTFGDAAAALIGQHYGRIRFRTSVNTRTIEGSMAFIGVAFLCVLFLLLGLTEISLVQCAVFSLLVATIASAVEALSPPGGSDNVSVPVATFFLLEVFLV